MRETTCIDRLIKVGNLAETLKLEEGGVSGAIGVSSLVEVAVCGGPGLLPLSRDSFTKVGGVVETFKPTKGESEIIATSRPIRMTLQMRRRAVHQNQHCR